jgi:hypothetical protein
MIKYIIKSPKKSPNDGACWPNGYFLFTHPKFSLKLMKDSKALGWHRPHFTDALQANYVQTTNQEIDAANPPQVIFELSFFDIVRLFLVV